MSGQNTHYSDDFVICPYCKHTYKPSSEDYSEDEQTNECSECGKKYALRQSYTVTHIAAPDCKLNGIEHAWGILPPVVGREHTFCIECGMYKRLIAED